MPLSLWEERILEGTAQLFSQEQQAQEEQTSSSNTTNIEEEVRRQVSDFMSQQAQAMHLVEQAPQGQGLGGFERLMQQVSGLTPAEGKAAAQQLPQQWKASVKHMPIARRKAELPQCFRPLAVEWVQHRCPSASPDLLAGLVTGMRQLQDVLIKKEQATSSADEPETVKPEVLSLPKLKGRPKHLAHRLSGLGDAVEGPHA